MSTASRSPGRCISTIPRSTGRTEVVVVGSGPAGLFAALRLIELGLRPVILERGRDVSARKRDIAQINRNGAVDPDSNYAFGEGGAGTFSDGKLFTRSKKRGDYNKALQTLVFHGATPEILYEAHPHIGTDKLPRIMQQYPADDRRMRAACSVSAAASRILKIEGPDPRRVVRRRADRRSRRGAGYGPFGARYLRTAPPRAACASRPSPLPWACASSIRRR